MARSEVRQLPITDEARAILRRSSVETHAAPTPQAKKPQNRREPPRILNCTELFEVTAEVEEMLFEGYPLPARGATLAVGTSKAGKTLLSIQTALAIASGKALFEYYRVLNPGPVLIIEQDDPSGAAAIKAIVQRSGGTADLPLFVTEKMPFGFGDSLFDWLGQQCAKLGLRHVVIDSYTAMRGPRGPGIDVVKAEQTELSRLDELAKRAAVSVNLIHHGSKTAAGMDWSQNAAGSYAVTAATESQIHVSRFSELDGAPERLVRIRGRHAEDSQMVLRFRKETLDYEFVLEGAAAPLWPLIGQIRRELGEQRFGIKELCHATGVSRATAHRQLDRLRQTDLIRKVGFGQYLLVAP
jgi:hypothetical protein